MLATLTETGFEQPTSTGKMVQDCTAESTKNTGFISPCFLDIYGLCVYSSVIFRALWKDPGCPSLGGVDGQISITYQGLCRSGYG